MARPLTSSPCVGRHRPRIRAGRVPVNLATGVPVNTAVTATFADPVDPTTITASTFLLTGPGGPVSGVVSYLGSTATFTPGAALAPNATYTATLTIAIKNPAGVPLAAPRSFAFTTGALPVPFVNGSFESDYAGWTLNEDSGNPTAGLWGIGTNGQALTAGLVVHDFFDNIDFSPSCFGVGSLTIVTAAGTKAAYNSQGGPENHRLWQNITIPAATPTLSWSMLYLNSNPFGPGQTLSIEVRNPVTDAILSTVFTTTGASPPSIPLTPMTASLAAFVGQTVRITVNLQAQVGCFFLEVDKFAMIP